jgi:hypothetical protein
MTRKAKQDFGSDTFDSRCRSDLPIILNFSLNAAAIHEGELISLYRIGDCSLFDRGKVE